jgi:hypothetical protein
MAGTGFHSVVANRTQKCIADCHEENKLTAECHAKNIRTTDCREENNRTADCHSQEYKFESGEIPVVTNCGTLESGLPTGYFCRGKPRCTGARFAQKRKIQY